jgi:DNA-binding MarR family transcriptional regulator
METERLLIENPSYSALWHLVRAYHSLAGRLGRFFEEHGITGAQFGVLRCLADAGPRGLMLSDLSRRLMVTCGNITGVVDRLEQAGYIRRERQPADRRIVLARLTPEGRALFDELMPAYLELVSRLVGHLTPEEQESLTGCARKLHLALEGAQAAEAEISTAADPANEYQRR